MFCATVLCILLPVALAVSLFVRSIPVLERVPVTTLLTSSDWAPSKGQFGFLPYVVGSVWVTVLAMVLATPLCLLTAVYISEYAPDMVRTLFKPVVDVLAGIPSVVYGLWGIIAIVPIVAAVGPHVGKYLGFVPGLSATGFVSGDCILSGAVVLAIMVAPVIISVAIEVLDTVPIELREAALSLGATRWQAVKHVVVRKSAGGLAAAVVLGFARVFGETMAVLMVVGNVPQVPRSVFDAAYPLPALIANSYGEMMSIPLYDSALLMAALWLMAIVVTFHLGARVLVWLLRRRVE